MSGLIFFKKQFPHNFYKSVNYSVSSILFCRSFFKLTLYLFHQFIVSAIKLKILYEVYDNEYKKLVWWFRIRFGGLLGLEVV